MAHPGATNGRFIHRLSHCPDGFRLFTLRFRCQRIVRRFDITPGVFTALTQSAFPSVNLDVLFHARGRNVEGATGGQCLTPAFRALKRNDIIATGPLCTVAGDGPAVVDMLLRPDRLRIDGDATVFPFRRILPVSLTDSTV
jgi:hypothetical protein